MISFSKFRCRKVSTKRVIEFTTESVRRDGAWNKITTVEHTIVYPLWVERLLMLAAGAAIVHWTFWGRTALALFAGIVAVLWVKNGEK